jgi:flagellar protein FlaI
MDASLLDIEMKALDKLVGRFVGVTDPERRADIVRAAARMIEPTISDDKIKQIIADVEDLNPIGKYLYDEVIEDIMVNNTNDIFVYNSREGSKNTGEKIADRESLELLVKKLKLYATNESSKGNIMDVHMPSGSRTNIVSSPLGYDITIRNFKKNALSIIDLINFGELDYQIAARLWVYTDGFAVRPANILIGGMPASGKTALLNAMFSFIRPDERVVTIEETYELNTETQDNCVRLETSEDTDMEALVKNALRMRPDRIIVGEVRGAEANDMITAMNIGKIGMCTVHASSARDTVNRLQYAPMNVPVETLSAIDAIIVTSQVFKERKPIRKIIQISEISGLETQVLLSDLYKFDYKTFSSMPILPSVTYRDTLSKIIGIVPQDILAEESVRAAVLLAMNKQGIRDIKSISQMVREYYDNPEAVLAKLGLSNIRPVITR